MNTYVPDNLWGIMLPSIDNTQLMGDCLRAEEHITEHVPGDDLGNYGSKTTASFNEYNLLTLPYPSFQNLYHNMVSVIKPCLPDEPHVMQCWLNVFRKGESIKWHKHWLAEKRVIHGFYCVNVTPSFTEYKYKHLPGETFKIESTEGLLVFGKSNNDIHQSSPWSGDVTPRITIAFDIVPLPSIDTIRANHFIPF